MDRETVARVARVARLVLTEEELGSFHEDLEKLLDYLSILDEAPENESFNFNPIPVEDILREDEPSMEYEPARLLRDMGTYQDYVRGPRL